MSNKGNFDMMEIGAISTLYGMENEKMVSEHFGQLYDLLVQSFDDEHFISMLRGMKKRSVRTISLSLVPENEVLCFVNKLWFNVQHSSSEYWDGYYVGIGVNFRRSKYNPFTFSKLWLSHTANGTIEDIREKITQPDFKERVCEKLCKHIFNSCNNEMGNMLGNK